MGILEGADGTPVTADAAPVVAPEGAPSTEAPAPEPEGEEAAPAESDQYTALAGRYAQMERQYRESERTRKTDGQSLSDLTAQFTELQAQLKDNPFELLEKNGHSYDKWTEKLLQKTPEQEVEAKNQALLDKIEALQSQVDERDTARTTERDSRARTDTIENLTRVVKGRDDLAYLGKLGQESVLYERFANYQTEFGECPPDVQEQLSLELEAESRETVAKNLESLAEVPHFRELLTTLMKKLDADRDGDSEEATPAAGKPQGETNGNGSRTPTSLTQTQTASGTERKAPEQKRSRQDRRQAIYDRMDERAAQRAGRVRS